MKSPAVVVNESEIVATRACSSAPSTTVRRGGACYAELVLLREGWA